MLCVSTCWMGSCEVCVVCDSVICYIFMCGYPKLFCARRNGLGFVVRTCVGEGEDDV